MGNWLSKENIKVMQEKLIDEMIKKGSRNNFYIGGYFLTYNEGLKSIKDLTQEDFEPFNITYLLKSCDDKILKNIDVAGDIYITPTNKYLNSKKSKIN